MSEDANISDNNPASEVLGAAVRRRPGRPKGLPKPEGSGRKPGTPNRVGKEARELASKYTTKAFKRLGELAQHPDPKVAVLAIQQILDRRFGKPVSPSEISGPDGAPLIPVPELTNMMRAKKLLFMVAKAKAEAGRSDRAEIEDLEHAAGIVRHAKPLTIEAASPDPFAAERERQTAEIAAATAPAPTPEPADDYPRIVAAQKAERALALAEKRPERPLQAWVDGSASPRPGEDFTPASSNVARFRPRR